MAFDKVIDSVQLDNDIKSVADAVRAKGGTTEQLSFPTGIVDAISKIQSGGGGKLFISPIVGTLSAGNGNYTYSYDYGALGITHTNWIIIGWGGQRRAERLMAYSPTEDLKTVGVYDLRNNTIHKTPNHFVGSTSDCLFSSYAVSEMVQVKLLPDQGIIQLTGGYNMEPPKQLILIACK